MRLTSTIFALFASALAVPAPMPDTNAVANTNNNDISIQATSDANPLSIRQELQCDWDDFCADAFQRCVQTCDSLKDSDCFNVVSSPSCEGCIVAIAGCS